MRPKSYPAVLPASQQAPISFTAALQSGTITAIDNNISVDRHFVVQSLHQDDLY